MANWLKPGLVLLRDSLKGLEDNISPESEIQHVIPDDHKLYELTSDDLMPDESGKPGITEDEVNELRKDFETRLKAYNETGKSQTRPNP